MVFKGSTCPRGSALRGWFSGDPLRDVPEQRVANENSPLEELMNSVMERRNLVAGLAIFIVAIFALTGTASAHIAHHKRAKAPSSKRRPQPTKRAWFTRCPRRSWTRASSAPPRASPTSSKSSAKRSTPRRRSRSAPTSSTANATRGCTGPSRRHSTTKSRGRAPKSNWTTTATRQSCVFGGPSCAAGESLLAAHLDVAPYTTTVTTFTVLPPRPTRTGRHRLAGEKDRGRGQQRRGDDRPGRVPARVR